MRHRLPCSRCDSQPNFRAAQRMQHRFIVKIGGGLAQRFLGPCLGFLRALDVNVLRRARQLSARIVTLSGNTSAKPHATARYCVVAARPIADLANLQLGNERRVSRQNPQLAVLAGYLDLVGILADQEPVGSHDL